MCDEVRFLSGQKIGVFCHKKVGQAVHRMSVKKRMKNFRKTIDLNINQMLSTP